MAKGYTVDPKTNKDGSITYHVRVRRKGINVFDHYLKKTLADQFGRRTVDEIDAGTYVKKSAVSKTITLNDAFKKFIESLPEKTHTQRTYKKNYVSYLNIVKRFDSGKFGKKPLGEFRRPDIADFRDQRDKIVSKQTAKNNINAISRIFRKAIGDWDVDVQNPVIGIERLKSPSPRNRRLEDDDEFKAILKEAGSLTGQPWVAPLIEFLVHSAFRLGEACRIRPQDILWDTREIFMQSRKGGKENIKVPIPQCAADVLRQFERNWGEKTIFQVKPNQASSVLGKFHQKLLQNGVIKEPLRAHDYRHEGTSRLFELKNNDGQLVLTVPYIVLYTGHTSIDVLVKTYANVRNADAKAVIDTVRY